MSRRSRTLKHARSQLRGDDAVTTVKTPADVLAIIPYLLGFTPAESLVVLSLDEAGPRPRLGPCMRADLVEPAEAPAQVQYLTSVVRQHRFTRVLLVAFTGDERRAEAVIESLRSRLRDDGVTVSEALRADGHRWWSYECDDLRCCPAEGREYDVETSQVAVDAVLSGMSKLPSRESLETVFDPLDAPYRDRVRAACARNDASGASRKASAARTRELVAGHVEQPAAMSAADAATVLAALQDDEVRDTVWLALDRSNADQQFELWCHLMRAAPDALMAPAGGLAGFSAWIAGRGALAAVAAERVSAVAPGYGMAVLLEDLLAAAVNPELWLAFVAQQSRPT